MDLGELMKMAGQWRQQLAKMEAEAGSVRAVGEAGGGMVRVTMDGNCVVQAVEIDAALCGQKDDRKLLEDLVRAATNAASVQAKGALRGRQGDMLRGLGLDPSMLEMLGQKAP